MISVSNVRAHKQHLPLSTAANANVRAPLVFAMRVCDSHVILEIYADFCELFFGSFVYHTLCLLPTHQCFVLWTPFLLLDPNQINFRWYNLFRIQTRKHLHLKCLSHANHRPHPHYCVGYFVWKICDPFDIEKYFAGFKTGFIKLNMKMPLFLFENC